MTAKGDPLGGNSRAHAIAKKLRAGMAPRKIAKQLDLNLAVVLEVQRKIGR